MKRKKLLNTYNTRSSECDNTPISNTCCNNTYYDPTAKYPMVTPLCTAQYNPNTTNIPDGFYRYTGFVKPYDPYLLFQVANISITIDTPSRYQCVLISILDTNKSSLTYGSYIMIPASVLSYQLKNSLISENEISIFTSPEPDLNNKNGSNIFDITNPLDPSYKGLVSLSYNTVLFNENYDYVPPQKTDSSPLEWIPFGILTPGIVSVPLVGTQMAYPLSFAKINTGIISSPQKSYTSLPESPSPEVPQINYVGSVILNTGKITTPVGSVIVIPAQSVDYDQNPFIGPIDLFPINSYYTSNDYSIICGTSSDLNNKIQNALNFLCKTFNDELFPVVFPFSANSNDPIENIRYGYSNEIICNTDYANDSGVSFSNVTIPNNIGNNNNNNPIFYNILSTDTGSENCENPGPQSCFYGMFSQLSQIPCNNNFYGIPPQPNNMYVSYIGNGTTNKPSSTLTPKFISLGVQTNNTVCTLNSNSNNDQINFSVTTPFCNSCTSDDCSTDLTCQYCTVCQNPAPPPPNNLCTVINGKPSENCICSDCTSETCTECLTCKSENSCAYCKNCNEDGCDYCTDYFNPKISQPCINCDSSGCDLCKECDLSSGKATNCKCTNCFGSSCKNCTNCTGNDCLCTDCLSDIDQSTKQIIYKCATCENCNYKNTNGIYGVSCTCINCEDNFETCQQDPSLPVTFACPSKKNSRKIIIISVVSVVSFIILIILIVSIYYIASGIKARKDLEKNISKN